MRALAQQLRGFTAAAVITALLVLSGPAAAHCDTMRGPVVLAGQAALESGDLTPALKWVAAGDEAEIHSAFQRARAVRAQGDEARALADQFFLETLVRIHRAGEGMPFTGIKRDEGEVAPAVVAADRALADDDVEQLVTLVADRVTRQIRTRFRAAAEARRRQDDSVDAGRHFVKLYVDFVHYVERISEAASADGADGHQHAGDEREGEEAGRYQ